MDSQPLCVCSDDADTIQCLPCQRRIISSFYCLFPLHVHDWEETFCRRPTFRSEAEHVGRSGAYSLEGKLYGLCMNTQYTYRHSFHPENCMRERPHDDILYYMTNLSVEQQIADDILKSVTVSTRRERYGLMPISVYEFQKWVYSVADNACATAHVEFLCTLVHYEEDILEIIRGDFSVHYEETYECIGKVVQLYLLSCENELDN